MTSMICSHCDRSFTPNIADEYVDAVGEICCEVCYCDICGHGHPTADEHDLCQAGADETSEREADPDLHREIALDGLLGV